MPPDYKREEVVKIKGWLSRREGFHRPLSRKHQSLPGIFAVNISIFVGYTTEKSASGIVCALGSILPSFFIILAIALFLHTCRNNIWVEKAFKGVASGGRRPDCPCLALTTARSIKMKLQRADYPYRCRTADLARRVVSCVDYSGGYHRRTCLRTENKERLI